MTPNDGAILWVWQERNPADGQWGTIGFHEGGARGLPGGWKFPPIITLTTRAESIARVAYREVAMAHYHATGHPVRLAKFVIEEIVETLA